MARPLGTSAQTIRRAPLLLIDLDTAEGITGRAYLFCYLPAVPAAVARILEAAFGVIADARVAPLDIGTTLGRHFRLIGVRGIVAMALAGIDVACWDALAVAAGMPLAAFLGGAPKPIRAYNSNGLGLIEAEAAADEAEELLAGGFEAIKMRLGRPTLEADLAAVRAVRKRMPDEIKIMVDFNQALTLAEAKRRCHAIDSEGIYWIEEPIRHDDYAGAALIARELSVPVQIGENFSLIAGMQTALNAKACDLVMPDLERIGGGACFLGLRHGCFSLSSVGSSGWRRFAPGPASYRPKNLLIVSRYALSIVAEVSNQASPLPVIVYTRRAGPVGPGSQVDSRKPSFSIWRSVR